jgi:hypothetical protein
MEHLPDPSPKQRLWTAGACSAAMVAAATLFITVLARLLPTGGGRPLLPGLRAGLDTTAQWLAPFGNLLNTLGGLPGIPSGSAAAAAPSSLPALGLIAAGLLGLATVLTLSASRPIPPAGQRLIRTP